MDHTLDHLSECFCLAYSAPCYQGQLFDDLGFMGDTECSKQILRKCMSTQPTLTSGQRRFCRKHTIPSHVCLAPREQPQFLPWTSNNIDKRQTNRHHPLSAVSPSCTKKWRHLIQCSWRYTVVGGLYSVQYKSIFGAPNKVRRCTCEEARPSRLDFQRDEVKIHHVIASTKDCWS